MDRTFLENLQNESLSRSACFFIISFIVLLAHFPVLFPVQIINPDAQFIFPILENVTGPIDYFGKLVRYETLDFQPVRDLTLLIDLYLYQITGHIFSVTFNCLIWAGACFFILQIMRELIPSRPADLLIIICFAVYPIFAQAINWGIARKHLLAFFFTTWATWRLLYWLRTNKGEFAICLLYALSVLSLPVSLLWPLWAILIVWFVFPDKWLAFRKTAIFLIVIMVLVTFINWSYYNTSTIFLDLYPKKEGRMDFILMFIALGHYVKQILFPYQLAFSYTYDTGAIIGLVIFLCLLGTFIYFQRKNRIAISWALFAAVHLVVLLSTPYIYFDTYLLMPSLALFIILVLITKKLPEKYFIGLIIPAIIWGVLTFISSERWKNQVVFFRDSFRQDTNCTNAIAYATGHYMKLEKIPEDLFRYIQENSCTELKPGDPKSKLVKLRRFEAIQLFVEDEIDLDYRLKRLHELGRENYAPMLMYASLLAKLDRKDEVEEAMRYISRYFVGTNLKIDYHPVYSSVLPSYCKDHQLPECNKLLQKFSDKRPDPFL